MPRVSYSQTFKNAGEVDKYPEFKLRTAEKSRGWLPDEPWMEWYHRIEAPMIEDGEVVMEVKLTKSGPVEVQKMQWIGSAFCIGQTGTPEAPGPLMLQGIDPENCPACESAANQTGVRVPEQRFAAPIIKYKVIGRGQNPYELIKPITAEVLVWAYTGRIHGMLHDLAAREEVELRKLDITVDLEDTPGADTYQKIKTLAAIRTPAWTDPKVKAYIRELWANEAYRPTDEQLRVACKGRDYPRPVLLDMVRRAERQYRDAELAGGSGGDMGAADAAFNGNLSDSVDALLDSGPAADSDPLADHPGGAEEFASAEQRAAFAAAKQEAQRAVAALDDPFGDQTDLTPPAPAVTTTGTAAAAAESLSGTEPKSVPGASASEDAAREQAVNAAADDMFGPSEGEAASPEPAKTSGNGRKSKAAASKPEVPAPASEPSLDAPEPVAAPAGAGSNVVDFDDLFS